MPPQIDPKMDDFGLLPLPYTLNLEDEDSEIDNPNILEKEIKMDFHKLVIIGVPHMMPNND